eukprot:CAMPEP_0197322556 /NCGR_PEP_ID=MMETSP0891-20130614/69971_1 /TAXON_ID=44058 ORGANISM="Aureoumbra lagunensis, Strain CCMP1510" /NCGR_SAMPLE_ID=MMETSP0891 /ASSEMBLY_ACC=CAM_ASM_000534 /LENGTH=561 /DNA_ID=CAMNT_0042814985 /DNA_START=126 /DNA_END=1811 /DNA_ORIENTATION=+
MKLFLVVLITHGAAYQQIRFRAKLRRTKLRSIIREDVPIVYPSMGDVVAFAGDWPGESSVGVIRGLRWRQERWMAEIVPLEDQVGDIWRCPSSPRRKIRTLETSELVPLVANYVTEIDGYLVEREEEKKNTSMILPLNGTAIGLKRRAEGYAILAADAIPIGGLPRINPDEEKRALYEYEQLKKRLISDAALTGTFGIVLVYTLSGLAEALAFALGACASLFYVILLSRATDAVGSEDRLSQNRFAPVLLAFAGLAIYHYYVDSASIKPLAVVPRDEFAAAAAGVLSYRLPLLLRGLGSGLEDSNLQALLPGSLGEVVRRSQKDTKIDGQFSPSLWKRTVLVICGPPGVGKSTLARRLVQEDARFTLPAWSLLSPNRPLEEYDDRPRREVLLDHEAVQNLEWAVLSSVEDTESIDSNYMNEPVQTYWALRRDELLYRTDNKVPVLDCDVITARQLEILDGARLVGVWLSLDSLDDLTNRLERAEADKALAKLSSTNLDDEQAKANLAQSVAKRAQARLASIIDDIDFGITSPMFEFTIINDDSLDIAYDKLKRAVQYVFVT